MRQAWARPLQRLGKAPTHSLFPIHIVTSVRDGRTHSLSVNVSDIFVFLGLMLFGPSVAASLATMDGAATGLTPNRINAALAHA